MSSSSSSSKSTAALLQLAFCAVGICSCYLYYGVLQEKFFSEKQLGATFLLATQCTSNTIVACIWQRLSNGFYDGGGNNNNKNRPNKEESSGGGGLNHPLFVLTSFFYVAAMGSSNLAIGFVSYPTVVLAKSCKLLPTMFMGTVLEGKHYSFFSWLAASMLSLGIALFHLSASSKNHKSNQQQQDDSIYGVILLILSLTCDGLLGSCQGLLKRRRTNSAATSSDARKKKDDDYINNNNNNNTRQFHHHHYSNDYRPPSAVETMLWVNLYAIVFLLPAAVWTGQWSAGMTKLFFHPSNDRSATMQSLRGLCYLNGASATGQIFIFLTITWFSPLVTTTITTTRKFFTILLSVSLYGHVFTMMQWCSIGLVFGGLYLGIVISSSTNNTRPTAVSTATTIRASTMENNGASIIAGDTLKAATTKKKPQQVFI